MPIIFADPKKISAVVVGKTEPDEMETDQAICEALAEDAIKAVKSGSAVELAKALKAFFHHVDAMPHEEGEHY